MKAVGFNVVRHAVNEPFQLADVFINIIPDKACCACPTLTNKTNELFKHTIYSPVNMIYVDTSYVIRFNNIYLVSRHLFQHVESMSYFMISKDCLMLCHGYTGGVLKFRVAVSVKSILPAVRHFVSGFNLTNTCIDVVAGGADRDVFKKNNVVETYERETRTRRTQTNLCCLVTKSGGVGGSTGNQARPIIGRKPREIEFLFTISLRHRPYNVEGAFDVRSVIGHRCRVARGEW